MQLGSDGDTLELYKKIPLQKMYVSSANDNQVQEERARVKNDRIQKKMDQGYQEKAIEDERELKDQIKNGFISLSKSSVTGFRLSEVTKMTYGPFVTRFWMLRKHMIMMDRMDLQVDSPFYSWDCLTLSFGEKKDLHLIIKNEKVMADFIKLLISKMNTLDGVKGSA